MRLSSQKLSALLVALIGVLFWISIGSSVVGDAYERDFLSLYTAGTLARTGHFSDLYNFDLQRTTQDSLVPGLALHFPFLRPPFYALFLAPLSLLPMHVAFPVWILLGVSGMFAVWVWAWRRFGPDSMVFCAFFLPTSSGIAHGQDCILLLLEMLAVWTLMEKRKDTLAGLVLSLTLFKWHLFLLVPLALLLRRRWKMLGAYAAGGSVLVAVSVAMLGASGIRTYLELLPRKEFDVLSSEIMMVGLRSMSLNLGFEGHAVQLLLTLPVVALVIWSALRSEGEMRWFWTAVVGSMLVSPHTFEYDLASMLIPGLIAVSNTTDRRLRIAAACALMPLSYFVTIAGAPWAIAPSLVVVSFLVALSGVLPVLPPLGVQPVIRRQSPAA